MRTGTADLPLHGGRAPRWLFDRMTLLAREMSLAILEEEGTGGLMRRLADPVWFQAFGCVLGFDWHSSGLTTTACGALKEGLRQVRASSGAGGVYSIVEVAPSEQEDNWLPGHCHFLAEAGVPMMELLNLEQLAQDGVYEFCFIGAPIRLRGATGSPLRPLAMPLRA